MLVKIPLSLAFLLLFFSAVLLLLYYCCTRIVGSWVVGYVFLPCTVLYWCTIQRAAAVQGGWVDRYIWHQVRWTFYRHSIPWEYLQSPRSESKWRKKTFLTETLESFSPFRGPVVGGDTFSRLLVAPIIGPEEKRGQVTLFYCSWGSAWHFSCFGVVVDTSWRKPPPSRIPLAQSTHFGSKFSPTSSKFSRGRHDHFSLQVLGLALVKKTCPHRPRQWQAIKKAKNGLGFP